MDKQFLELLTAKPVKPPKPDPVILVRTEKLKKDLIAVECPEFLERNQCFYEKIQLVNVKY